jgi:L-ribulose-5-phosphate 4-epimerase
VHDELRNRVLAANVAIVDAGLVTLTFGNASAVDRAAGVMAIKPSGVPYDELAADQIVLLDLVSGDVLCGGLRPSSDAPTHRLLYLGLAGLGGIVHTHSPFATAWAQAGREIPCLGTTHADHFAGPVPITRALSVDEIRGAYEERTGDVIVEAIRQRGLDPLIVPGALVVQHGPFTWGADVETAVENAVALEAIAALAYRTFALRPDQAVIGSDLQQRHFTRKHGPTRYYGQP